MIQSRASLEEAVQILNRLYWADPAAMGRLVETREGFDPARLAEALPAIQSRPGMAGSDPKAFVGLLGVINALFGADEHGDGAIAAHYVLEAGEQKLAGFHLLRNPSRSYASRRSEKPYVS